MIDPLAKLAQWNEPNSLKPGQQVTKGAVLFMRADGNEPAPEAEAPTA